LNSTIGADSVYVISLARLHKRRQQMQSLQDQLGCKFNVVDAYDSLEYEGNLTFIDEHLSDTFFDPAGYITLGAICCALSHRKAWKQFLDSNDEIGLFLEDDIYATDYISSCNFDQIRQDLSKLDWGVCWYGKYADNLAFAKMLTHTIADYVPHIVTQYAAHSYLLTRESAQWFYNATSKLKYAVDVQLELSPFNQVCLPQSIFKQFKSQDAMPTLIEELTQSNTFSQWDDSTKSLLRLPDNFIPMQYSPKTLKYKQSRINGWQFKKHK
jgi:GR25 family glycosyltransferase involved in LPS biosynthesis